MSKCNFNKVAHECYPVNLLHIFRIPLSKSAALRKGWSAVSEAFNFPPLQAVVFRGRAEVVKKKRRNKIRSFSRQG